MLAVESTGHPDMFSGQPRWTMRLGKEVQADVNQAGDDEQVCCIVIADMDSSAEQKAAMTVTPSMQVGQQLF